MSEAFLFAIILVAGSMAIITALFGLGALFLWLISIITGVPIPSQY